MSLTNPTNVVTEERLSEFYGEILPYLGGMPEALANKFSKSDLYSTDEKIIGCWTDGRPIYQKTFATKCPTVTTDGIAVLGSYIDIGASIENVVNCFGEVRRTDGYTSPIPFVGPMSSSDPSLGIKFAKVYVANNYVSTASSRNKFAVQNNSIQLNNSDVYVTLQYTKTTDAANSFKYGNETDYSTDEKIVGTWIDGKLIYQKTISLGTSAIPNAEVTTTAHNISNIAEIIDIKAIVHATSGLGTTILPRVQDNNAAQLIGLDVDGTSIYLKGRGANFKTTYGSAYVTIQYTKTTD